MAKDYTAEQLINLIAKASTNPTERLLALFDQLAAAVRDPDILVDPLTIFTDALTNFYLKQANHTTAESPDSLAAHLLLMAQKSLIDALSNQSTESLSYARTAAAALIEAQCPAAPPKAISLAKKHWFGVAASTMLFSSLGWYLWSGYQLNQHPTSPSPIVAESIQAIPLDDEKAQPTAKQASEMYHQYEMMRNGSCRYIEAIQIPDEHKDIYLKNVVGGMLPKNLKDLAIANEYLKKIQCSYTPMLMKKST